MAPEMPQAMYNVGETVLPVCPTWSECGLQPASTEALEAPTTPPITLASSSRILQFSGPPIPLPPDTMTPASVRSCFFAPWVTNSLTVILVVGFWNERDSTDGLIGGTLSFAVNTFGRRVATLGFPFILTFSDTLPA